MAWMNEEQEDEAPFDEGDYVLVVNDEPEFSVFGTVIEKINEQEFVITDANGNETDANGEDMLHAEEGDLCWLTWLIPKGSCLVNLDPEDKYYTTEQHDHVDFNMLADKLLAALTKKFKGVDFTVTPISYADTAGKTHAVINNSCVPDREISTFVAGFLSKTSRMKIWFTDDDEDVSDEEAEAEADEAIRQIEEEESDEPDEESDEFDEDE
nr:hypothetical protein [Candidatus Sigynarchaeota archaeon]